MAGVLDWTRFGNRRVGPEKAFEAFCAQLFERWLRREHAEVVTSYTLHGAGGDGGVEAFARLSSGNVVGLQAKWFDANLDDGRVGQIRASLDRAVASYGATLRQYTVSMPRNLTASRRKGERGGVERWEQFIKDVAVAHPAITIVRWDEAGLLEQLTASGNQEVKALWFEGELTLDTVSASWRRTKSRLEATQRYLPDLHAVGCIEATLAADLWTGAWVDGARDRVDEASRRLVGAAADLSHFAQLTADRLSADLQGALTLARAEVADLATRAGSLFEAIATGPPLTQTTWPTARGMQLLTRLLEEHKRRDGFHTGELATRAARAFGRAEESLRTLDEELRGSSSPRVFAGPAGCGKTHASAAAVDRAVAASAPAVIILAKGCDPRAGAARLLGDALDVPGWPLRRILDGLEALATIEQLREDSGSQKGFDRCVVIFDGLEESAGAGAWTDVLADLTAELATRPRVHLVVTTRPEFLGSISLPPGVEATHLPEDSETSLPEMLRAYAAKFDVSLDQVPWLGWALRSPLEVRLLAEEFQGCAVTAAEGACANLLMLFRLKLARLETEARGRAGSGAWSEGIGLIPSVLTVIADATGDGAARFVADKSVVAKTHKIDPEFSAERVRTALSILVEHGLVDAWIPPSRSLRGPQPEYGLSTRHLSDFILATGLAERALTSIRALKRPKFPMALRWRESAAGLFAAMLAEDGHFVRDIEWKEEPDHLFELHADALALVSPALAGRRSAEVAAWLTKATVLNRALLRRVILPVARIPRHPLGPRLLDAALRALPLRDRDPVWSVPEDLDGTGPWRDCYDDVLDEVHLDPAVDQWDGMPLVAAWMLASVVEARRIRARQMLAVWGASRLDQMVHLVRHMAVVDDPQLVDDLLVAALGATIGAKVPDDATLDLARLVDGLFFTEDAAAWTPSVQVRVAARGIVERANLVFPGAVPDLVARATPPYRPRGGDWPTMDLDEARTADGHFGGKLVHYPAQPYVAERATREFFATEGSADSYTREFPDHRLLAAIDEGQVIAPPNLAQARKRRAGREAAKQTAARERHGALMDSVRALYRERGGEGADPAALSEHELLEWVLKLPEYARERKARTQRIRYSKECAALFKHAARVAGFRVTPVGVQNGMIAHLVRSWGWSEARFSQHDWERPASVVDDAIAKRHGSGPDHGTRSRVAQFREKYIFAAVDRVAGELADRLPVWSRDSNAWVRVTNMDGLGNGLPDPLPATVMEGARGAEPPAAWEPPGILPEQFADEPDLARRAEMWLTEGALPDPRRFVSAPIGDWQAAAILGLSHYRRGHQGCVDQLVQLRAFGARAADLPRLRRDAPFTAAKLYDHGAWVEEGVYLSPALACWAPWLTWSSEDQGYDSFDETGEVRRVELRSAVGSGTARFEGDHPREPTVWMPAPSLARALGVVTFQGDRWSRRYVDRRGACVALERDVKSDSFAFDHQYLAMDIERYVSHLTASDMVPVWVVRMWIEATPALFMSGTTELDVRDGLDHHTREVVWLVIGDPGTGPQEVLELRNVLEAWTHRKSERATRRANKDDQSAGSDEVDSDAGES